MDEIGSASVLLRSGSSSSRRHAQFGLASECIMRPTEPTSRGPSLPTVDWAACGLRPLQGEQVLCVMPPGSVYVAERYGDGTSSPHEIDDLQFDDEEPAAVSNIVCLLTNYRLFFRHGSSLPAVHIPYTAVARVEVTADHCVIALRFDARQYVVQFQGYVSATGNTVRMGECCRTFCSTLLRCVDPVEGTSGTFAFYCGQATLNDGDAGLPLDACSELFDIWSDDSPLDDTRMPEVEPTALDDAAANDDKAKQALGWPGGYNIHSEYRRMGLDVPDTCWKVDSANTQSALSPTYPPLVILPTRSLQAPRSDTFYTKLAAYRTRARFPVLTWKNPRGHHVILRAAQPLVGFLGARGPEDEWVVDECMRFAQKESGSKVPFCILDARSYAAALSNGYAGGGYEKTDNYPSGTTIDFLSLANVHAVASVHSALMRAATTLSVARDWCHTTDAVAWLQHVTDLLEAAGGSESVVSKIVNNDACVLVHCTDGWDRTTQLVSLAQIMLDPFFRTVKGLRVLLEKDWLHFGHPFHARSQHAFSARYANAPQTVPSPVFLLFLTSLRQLMLQHPTEFEYKESLLWCLAKVAAGYGPFSDFMCDSEAQRERLRLRTKTRSVWGWVYARRGWFLNPTYRRRRSGESWKDAVIRPNFSTHGASLWIEYYFPSAAYMPLLNALLSDSPASETPAIANPALQDGSAQFHQVWMFMKRRRRRALVRALDTWRSQCGWTPSTWSSQDSAQSVVSDDYSYTGTDESDEPPRIHSACSAAADTKEDAVPPSMFNLASSWIDVNDDVYRRAEIGGERASRHFRAHSKPLQQDVQLIWRRASSTSVPWEEDVFAPDRLPPGGKVEWDEDVFITKAGTACSGKKPTTAADSDDACRAQSHGDAQDACHTSKTPPSYRQKASCGSPLQSSPVPDDELRDTSSVSGYVML
ncbi:protein-tyrosine phosphatase-like protein [Thamnocephalis sphaerospora]|uniref:Protein-tyrosine phosphatase-like protein n=1 Tax=Thamnocephalis sphaerospora TaxID=78915 RepID=A0A4P9XT21_9FUNG|nr:protein-tyrosine phosphatase-like protein [Thamnocephalis sphaerospora]|eukprot:RKP09308.1 protein-tyrosine phosphatase-like protein [Thamnocephalis sphaerospora]